MVDTLWADVSEFQVDVNDLYPYHFLAFRSNDGTYIDPHFNNNLAWAKRKCDAGKLAGFLVYFVYEENAAATLATFKAMVGRPHPQMAVMIDVESWGGRMHGDHSANINWVREELIRWLGTFMSPLQRLRKLHRKRVVVYGNVGDLNDMYRYRSDSRFIVANYSQLPTFTGMLGHQFSDRYPIPPFGNCDVNTANGMTPQQLAAALGLGKVKLPPTKPVVGLPVTPVTPKPVTPAKPVTVPVTVPITKPVTKPVTNPPAAKHPKPHPSPLPLTYLVRGGDTLSSIANSHKTTWAKLQRLNHLPNPNVIYVGQRLRVR